MAEVTIALSLVMVFAASTLSIMVVNQRYSQLNSRSNQANRINQGLADVLMRTNYANFAPMTVTNYDGLVGDGRSAEFREFRTRPGTAWRTNVNAVFAYESVVRVEDFKTYREARIETYWEGGVRFMTNRMTFVRAKDD